MVRVPAITVTRRLEDALLDTEYPLWYKESTRPPIAVRVDLLSR